MIILGWHTFVVIVLHIYVFNIPTLLFYIQLSIEFRDRSGAQLFCEVAKYK